jgi:hypothetical protein
VAGRVETGSFAKRIRNLTRAIVSISETNMPEIYVTWHDWANYHETTFTDRKKAADYIRRIRQMAPRHLTRLTVIHV